MALAEVKILVEGYTNADSVAETGEEKTCPTISLVRDKNILMVVDPGVLEDRQVLVDKLKEEGVSIDDINIVCITHSHIDHYRNIGMFEKAKTLEYYGLWHKDNVEDWKEQFSENIQILRTPGHDRTSITLFVKTEKGVIAICGDVFWKENYPKEDFFAENQMKLEESRKLVYKMADWVIPGHGPMYRSEKLRATGGSILRAKKESNILSSCKKCHRPFLKTEDRCKCRPKICYRCCECGQDCDLCNCRHKI